MDEATRRQFARTLRELRERANLSQRQLAHQIPVSQASLSRYESGKQTADPTTAARLDDLLDTGGALRALMRSEHPDSRAAAGRTPLAGLEGFGSRGSGRSLAGGDDTQRRDALRLGLLASTTPEVVSRVLRGAAAEAAEFTRHAEASVVGTGVLDHLEMVVSDLVGSYSRESPRELFAVAYKYRRRVEEMIRGPHTLSEARELYVYAGWLSESLAWTAHDLGDPVAADAYCVDAFEHASQAGHDELCAWAMDARASIAMYADRPKKALDSALAGIFKAPGGHPIAVRLHAQAARAHAKLGHSEDFRMRWAVLSDCMRSYPRGAHCATAWIRRNWPPTPRSRTLPRRMFGLAGMLRRKYPRRLP